MKKITPIVFGISCMLAGFIIGCCPTPTIASSSSQDYQLKIWKENTNDKMEIWKLVDDETGVNNIVVAPRWSEGYKYDGVCITPRLKLDGRLYISDKILH